MRRSIVGLLIVGLIIAAVFWARMTPAGHHGHVRSATFDLGGFLMLGLLSGFGHCVGMCSPFVLFVSRAYGSQRRSALAAQVYYATGRVATYAVLGAGAGLVGAAIESAGALVGLRRVALMVAGVVLLAWAAVALADAARFEVGNRLFARVTAALKGHVPGHPLATGLFLGLLPCGMLYSAVVAAVPSGGAMWGAAALALFGLGTVPALLGVSLADNLLVGRRALLNRLSQVFILAMGARFLWMALAR